MLPPPTPERVLQTMPDSFAMPEGGQVYDWPLDKWWADEDHDTEDTDRPAVFVEQTLTGVLREQDQPLSDTLGRTDDPDSTVSHNILEGLRLRDEWTVTISDSGQYHGTTASDRVKYATHELKSWVMFDASDDLYNAGPNGAIPVLIDIIPGGGGGVANQMVDDRSMKRRVFTIQLKYTYGRKTAVDLVKGFDVRINDGPLTRITAADA